MGRNTTWLLLAGAVLAALMPGEALKGTTLVINKLKGKQADGSPLPTPSPAPVAESRSDVDVESPTGEGGEAAAGNATTKSPLTGIPQIDYVHDPNLPRELNGYNLTEYPFYDRVPEDIDFKCDGLHDGFYASIPHKCQVYHHCLFGTRYDFLCANYTAFDQKTFICHFVSEVDCLNSPKYFKRNEALYKAASTAAPSTTTTTTQAPPPPPPPIRRPIAATGPGGRRKRPYRRRRPVYDYYYDEDYEDEPDYYEDDVQGQQGGAAAAPPPPPPRRRRKRPRPQQRPQPAQEYDEQLEAVQEPAAVLPGDSKPRSSSSVYSRPRVPPKIRRPVPLNEREKFDYKKSGMLLPDSAEDTRPTKSQTSTAAPPADDYYDDEEEYVPPARGTQASKPRNPDYYPPPAANDREVARRPVMAPASRPPRRNRPSAPRRRPVDTALPLEDSGDDYYDSYEQDPPPPPPPRRRPANGRKRPSAASTRQEPDPYYRQPTRTHVEEDYPPPRKQAPTYSQRGGGRYEDEEDDLPVPAPRPAYISTGPANSGPVRQVHRKRIPPPEDDYESYSRRPSSQGSRKQTAQRQPPPASYEDSAEYYDDEEVEEQPVQTSSRPRPKQQSGYRSPAPATAPPSPSPRPSPSPPASKELEDEEEVILPPSRAPSRPFLPSRGGSPTLPRGLQPLGAKAEPSPSKSSSAYRTRIDDSQPLTAPEPVSSKPSKEGEAPTGFRTGGGDIASARPKTQSGRDDQGARTSGKYKPSSARPEPAKNDDLSNAKTSPPLQQKTTLPPIDEPPARNNLADIEDYDVSLNDALHPSLQSTRSVATGIVSFPQLAPSRPQSFRSSGRGGAPLVTAASQRQITRAPYEPEVGQTYLQPARKAQQYGEVDLEPPPQYRVEGQALSLATRGGGQQQGDRLYVSQPRGYSRDY